MWWLSLHKAFHRSPSLPGAQITLLLSSKDRYPDEHTITKLLLYWIGNIWNKNDGMVSFKPDTEMVLLVVKLTNRTNSVYRCLWLAFALWPDNIYAALKQSKSQMTEAELLRNKRNQPWSWDILQQAIQVSCHRHYMTFYWILGNLTRSSWSTFLEGSL